MKKHPDALGLAYKSYFEGNANATFTLHSQLFDADEISVAHFFRTYSHMPMLEQKAIDMALGKILDVGAGSGTHSLELQQRNLDVTALDISPLSIEIMEKRGVKNTECKDFFEYSKSGYDTILFLMNGIGLIQSIENFPVFFTKISELLSPTGQVLIDSSDLCYLFENEDGSFDFPLNSEYYGQVDFTVEFEGNFSELFNWVYVDFNTLQYAANNAGFECELVAKGEHYDFLARITRK